MPRPLLIPTLALALLVPIATTGQQVDPEVRPAIPVEAPTPDDEPSRGPAADLPPDLAEDVAMLEAVLRVRESRIAEARRLLELERDVLDAVRQRREAGGIPAREVERFEVRQAAAEALVEARQADRDEVAIRLEQVRRLSASPSPEPDVDEQRTRLDEQVRIREAQLRAREARFRAAEAQVASENLNWEQFQDSVRRGTEGPGRIRQATHRLAEATSWRETMAAEREVSRLLLLRAQRRRSQFDDPEAADPTLEGSERDGLDARVSSLEHLIDVLRDELYHVQWELQGLRDRLP